MFSPEVRRLDNNMVQFTIMHTQFMQERAQPGMIVIGSDSHTCSAGSVSCLAVGMGAADVTMPLVLGQTWFKVRLSDWSVRIAKVDTVMAGSRDCGNPLRRQAKAGSGRQRCDLVHPAAITAEHGCG